MAYNITAVSNTTGMLDLIQQIDNHIFCAGAGCGGDGGLLGAVILVIIFAVLMVNFISNGRELNSSVTAASFVCFIIGMLFYLMDIIAPLAIYITILVWGIGVAFGSRQ
jgi:hypothetical protein